MSCLNCENYWQNTVDETKCEKCGEGRVLADVSPVMPPLVLEMKKKEEQTLCFMCEHQFQFTTSDVACCNCCDDGEYFSPMKVRKKKRGIVD